MYRQQAVRATGVVSLAFPESFMTVSRVFQVSFMSVSRKFKDVAKEIKGILKQIRKFQGVFSECFKKESV